MRSKDNTAVTRLFGLLESRYAMRVIWALGDGHPQTFRLLQDSVGGITPNTLNTRLKELRAASLVEHTGDGYRLTAQGAELARRMTDVQQFAGKWGLMQARFNAGKATATATATASAHPHA